MQSGEPVDDGSGSEAPAASWLWPVALTILGLLIVAVWHVSIMWLARDDLRVLGSLLLALFAATVAARQAARRIPRARRRRVARAWARLDRVGLVFVAFLLALVLLFHAGFERAASDGRSYFVQVRSLVMDGDLDFANEQAAFGARGADNYAFGAPVLWTPFFVASHAWLHGLRLLGADVRTDGYYYPYQRAVGLGTLVYGFLGLVLAYRVVRAYFDRTTSALATLGFCATSFLLWYLTVENSMVHGVSMFATTLFLFLWHQYRGSATLGQWAWLGAAAGLMAMVRWQNVVFAVLPVADLLWIAWRADAAGSTVQRMRRLSRRAAAFGAAAVAAFVPQLVFWQTVYGNFLHVPASEHAFTPALLPPALIDVLFSSNRGLLAWTPVVSASLAGLVYFGWRHRRVAMILAGGLLGQLWVNAAVEVWWGGAGFGARRFANSSLVFVLGLAALLTLFRRRPLLAPSLILGALLVFNATFMMGYRDGTLPATEGVAFDSAVGALYERIGNPFSWPVGAWVAWRYDVNPALYDRLRGRAYNNLTIDVGGPDDARFLGRGWAAAERAPDRSFRWADAPSSTFVVPLQSNADDYVLDVEWAPFTAPGLPGQVVEVEVNGTRVASVPMAGGWQRDRITVDRGLIRVGLNQVRLVYRYAASPADHLESADTRTLAIQVAEIRLLRQSGS